MSDMPNLTEPVKKITQDDLRMPPEMRTNLETSLANNKLLQDRIQEMQSHGLETNVSLDDLKEQQKRIEGMLKLK